MDPYDLVISGAGMVGASFALAMAQAGRRVLLLEAQAPETWSAAGPYSFARLSHQSCVRTNIPLFTSLGRYSATQS